MSRKKFGMTKGSSNFDRFSRKQASRQTEVTMYVEFRLKVRLTVRSNGSSTELAASRTSPSSGGARASYIAWRLLSVGSETAFSVLSLSFISIGTRLPPTVPMGHCVFRPVRTAWQYGTRTHFSSASRLQWHDSGVVTSATRASLP